MTDEFDGLNPGGGGGDAYQRQAPGSREVALVEPRFKWEPAIAERYGEIGVKDDEQWQTLIDAIYPSAKTIRSVMMVLAYCKTRKLDPFKRPVHIVPMWHSALGREVETVWPGIGELRTTAQRTGQFAGMDEPEFGQLISETFIGEAWHNRVKRVVEKTVVYPEWCRVTVYRKLGEHICKYVGPKTYWKETYATMGRTILPNSMWERRSIGQLEKCAEAAALRRAFPEDIGSEYVAEEMEGRPILADEDSRILIEGQAVETVNDLSETTQEIEPAKPNGQDHAPSARAVPVSPPTPPAPAHWTDGIDIPAKSKAALVRAGISRDQAYAWTDAAMIGIHGFGKGGLEALRKAIGQAPKAMVPVSPLPPPTPPQAPPAPPPPPPVATGLDAPVSPSPPPPAAAPQKNIADFFHDAIIRCTSVEELKKTAESDWNHRYLELKKSTDPADVVLAKRIFDDYSAVLAKLTAEEEAAKAKPAGLTDNLPENASDQGELAEEDAKLYNWPDDVEAQIALAGSSDQLRAWARELWDGFSLDDVEGRYRLIERSEAWGNATAPERTAVVKVRAVSASRYR